MAKIGISGVRHGEKQRRRYQQREIMALARSSETWRGGSIRHINGVSKAARGGMAALISGSIEKHQAGSVSSSALNTRK